MTSSNNPPILSGSRAPELTPREDDADAAPRETSVRSFTAHGDDGLTVALQGEIDHHSAGPLRLLLASARRLGYRSLVLDTSLVTFADSALLRILRDWTDHGCRLRLTGVTPAMERLRAAAWGCPSTCRRHAHVGRGKARQGA